MNTLDARFKVTPSIANQSAKQTTPTTAVLTEVVGSKVYVHPRQAGDGLTFRWRLAGTKTGTTAAHTVALYINGTAVLTLTADDNTAVDWVADITVIFVNISAQKAMGTLLSDTADPDVDYAAGTVDCSSGATLSIKTNTTSTDTVTHEMVTVEKWEFSPMAKT